MVPFKSTRQVLHHHHLAPKKKLGQNFLIDSKVTERIVSMTGITSRDTVIEIGVGLGALTRPLAAAAGQVIGYEIDRGIVGYHQEENDLPANVILRHQDFLTVDLPLLATECGSRLKIVANLPYSISNPLVFQLIAQHQSVQWAVLMLQKEVAMRLAAAPGTKDFGVASVLLATCATVTRLMRLGPGHFHPRPKVDSQVVRLDFHPLPAAVAALPAHNRELLQQIVRSGFQQRRKTLANGLDAAGLPGLTKTTIETALMAAGFPVNIRGEELAVLDWIKLCNTLEQAR